MAGFILGTGSGVLAAAATYYTLSTHLHRDTDALREELERANRTIDTSFNPSHPAAPVSYIGPSRNPYEPTFGEQLRLKWNRAVESGLENVRETDWTAVGAGVVQGGKDIVGRLNGEVPATTTTPAAHLPARDDIRETLDGAKDAIYRGEKKMEHAAEDAVQSVQDAATTAGRSVANSSASLLERLTGAFAGAKSRTDDAVARAQQEAGHLAGEAKDEARHLSNATSNAAHRTADAARHAGLSLRDDARQVGSHANNAAHRAAGAAKDAGLSLREEAHHVGSVADDAAHRAASAAKDAGLSLRDEARHFGNAADNAAHQAAATAKHAGLSLRDEARHVSHVAEDAASRAASSVADTARSAGQTIQTEARHLANVTEDAAHRAAASVRETAHDIKDTISPPPPSTAQRLYDGVKDTITGAVHAVEDKGEEMKQATDNKVNRMMAEKKLKGGLEEYHEGILKGASGVGVISGNGLDVNKESFTGGNNLKVRASRKAEGSVMGRLV